jgi:hypothetical protein
LYAEGAPLAIVGIAAVVLARSEWAPSSPLICAFYRRCYATKRAAQS